MLKGHNVRVHRQTCQAKTLQVKVKFQTKYQHTAATVVLSANP